MCEGGTDRSAGVWHIGTFIDCLGYTDCRWDPDGSVEMIMAPPQDALIATAAAVNNGGHAFRWADEFDEEENERIAADEGFNERCTKEIVLGAS